MISPLAIKMLISATAIALCAGLGYGVVSTYRGAIQRAQEAEQTVSDMRASLAERDAALAGWKAQSDFWRKEREDAAKALEVKEAERAAQAALYAKSIKEFNDALAQLEGEDLACASRPVPASLDRLFAR